MSKTAKPERADLNMAVEMTALLAVQVVNADRKRERENMLQQGRGSCPKCGRTAVLRAMPNAQDRLQLFCVCSGDRPVLEVAGRLGVL